MIEHLGSISACRCAGPRFSVGGVGAFAVVLLLAGLVCLPGCKRRDGSDPRDTVDEKIIPVDEAAGKPLLEFPKAVRCEDESLNAFIEDFYDTCCRGEYDKFRLMMSTRVDPFTPERFKKSLTAVDRVQIEVIKKLPDVTEVPPPIYVVRSKVFLRKNVPKDALERTISILVFREAGKWVMAPAPKHLAGELDILIAEESGEGDAEGPAADAEKQPN